MPKEFIEKIEEEFDFVFADPFRDKQPGEKILAYSIDSIDAKRFIRAKVQEAYLAGKRDMKQRAVEALDNMAIEVAGNSAKTADQAIHTINALTEVDK